MMKLANCEIKFLTFDHVLFQDPEKKTKFMEGTYIPMTLHCNTDDIYLYEYDDKNKSENKLIGQILLANSHSHLASSEKGGKTLTISYCHPKGDKTNEIEFRTGGEVKVLDKMDKILAVREHKMKYQATLAADPSRENRASLLSRKEGKLHLRGLADYLALLGVFLLVKLMAESVARTGLLFTLGDLGSMADDIVSFATVSTFLNVMMMTLLIHRIEQQATVGLISETACLVGVATCSIWLLLYPSFLIRHMQPRIFTGILMIGFSGLYQLKFLSFAHVMYEIREALRKFKLLRLNNKDLIRSYEYFDADGLSVASLTYISLNLDNPAALCKLSQLMYFFFAPTCCYQMEYPRNKSIRVFWLISKVAGFLLLLVFKGILFLQFSVPTLQNLSYAYEHGKVWMFIENFTTFAPLATLHWFLFFYLSFELGTNIAAELTRFADREFYLEWWNCTSIPEFWKLWNRPIHHWMMRHIHAPLLRLGYSKSVSLLIVFLFSAYGHEVASSVSLHTCSCWFFMLMLFQAPAIMIQEKISKIFGKSELRENLTFWFMYCFVGMPWVLFIYSYLYGK